MFEVVECESAESFLESLAPVSRYFRPSGPEETVLFRGCADASWHLMPSALRDARGRTLRHQVRIETDALARFAWGCDENGLPVPGDGEKLRADIIALTGFGAAPPHVIEAGVLWPTDHWLGLMALAQHSGLRTRL